MRKNFWVFVVALTLLLVFSVPLLRVEAGPSKTPLPWAIAQKLTVKGQSELRGGTYFRPTDTVPTAQEGMVYWNDTNAALMMYNGSTWISSAAGLFDDFQLVWIAGQRGKPGINADILNATEATRMVADPDFEVLGSNGSSDDVTFCAEGGITLQTDGGGTDSVILLPHLDANQSAWTQVTWGTDKSTRWECVIVTGSDITPVTIWAGLKLTNTSVTATDDDACFFRFEDTNNDGEWEAISSIADVDDEHDTDVAVAVSTAYHLVIDIQADRTAKMYINGTLKETTDALTDATDLIPYIGILEGDGNAKDMTVRGAAISRSAG